MRMMIGSWSGVVALVIALSSVTIGAARADGGRDDTVPTCPRGQV